MPKMKVVSGAKKRFRVTASGELKRKRAYRRHILTSKNRKRKRLLRRSALVDASNLNLPLRALAMR